MADFQSRYNEWIEKISSEEQNPRRAEMLKNGLGHGTVEFLRKVWFPVAGHFNYLSPEWEVRDFANGCRYLDLAYLPDSGKVCIEIQGYGPHARDLDTGRFKDLCWRHSFLALDGWTILPIAYLSIRDEPKKCQQLILALIGKYSSIQPAAGHLNWLETEILRYASRKLRPFAPGEVEAHLQISNRHARKLLQKLTAVGKLLIASGTARARTYKLTNSQF
ncbi:transcriptional regulator [Bacillus mangrovi]|uniref:Transcriptional regulator n=1 Tax=Metabacillus mangrovi TaxID=1491830 RepID=A0A7X2V330_9BACI|nr:transcriptional regulator [Metabacillus mangrovi]MTH52005.1 transcriptional regulator [Metabacillus mangrovi]